MRSRSSFGSWPARHLMSRGGTHAQVVVPHSRGPGFFFSGGRRHTSCLSDWSSDVCSSDLRLDESREAHANQFYENLIRYRDEARKFGELVGVVLSTFVEPSGGVGFESATVRVERSGDKIGRASCRERRWRPSRGR